MQQAKQSKIELTPSGPAGSRRRAAHLVIGLALVAFAVGCGASFNKSDTLTDEDIAGARGEAERRLQAGQRLQILRSQARAAAASASPPASAAPAPTPPAAPTDSATPAAAPPADGAAPAAPAGSATP